MTDIERKLITIAKLALEALDLEVSPSSGEQKPVTTKTKFHGLLDRAIQPNAPKPDHARRMVCTDCGRGFLLKGSLLDATCPSCKSIHVKPRHEEHS